MSDNQAGCSTKSGARLSELARACIAARARSVSRATLNAWLANVQRTRAGLNKLRGAEPPTGDLGISVAMALGARISPQSIVSDARAELRALAAQLDRLVKAKRIVPVAFDLVGQQWAPNLLGLRQFLEQTDFNERRAA